MTLDISFLRSQARSLRNYISMRSNYQEDVLSETKRKYDGNGRHNMKNKIPKQLIEQNNAEDVEDRAIQYQKIKPTSRNLNVSTEIN